MTTETNDHFEVQIRDDGIVWMTRLDVPYTQLSEIKDAYEFLRDVVVAQQTAIRLRYVARGDRGPFPFAWLYDVRGAPRPRTDSAFEAAQAQYTPSLFALSPLLCTLCGTQAGAMQVARMSASHDHWSVTTVEADAVARLRTSLKG